MKKNAFVLTILIITSLLFNGIFPKYALCSQGYDEIFSLIQSQPLLQYFHSMTAVPVNILDKLLAEGMAPGSSTKRDSGEKNKCSPNTSADFFITGTERFDGARSPLSRAQFAGNTPVLMAGAPYAIFLVSIGGGGGIPDSGGGNAIALLLLMLMALLPRSGIGDGGSMKRFAHFLRPIWRQTKLGFSFGEAA